MRIGRLLLAYSILRLGVRPAPPWLVGLAFFLLAAVIWAVIAAGI